MGVASERLPVEERRGFLFVVVYRWLSLAPAAAALVSWAPALDTDDTTRVALAVAAAVNVLITLLHAALGRLVLRWPALLAADLAFCAALIGATGGWHSPFYLHALSPLLAAGLFFGLRGALIAAGLFSLFLVSVLLVNVQFTSGALDREAVVRALIGAVLVAGAFGYAGLLLRSLRRHVLLLQVASDLLRERNATLARTNRELQSLHNVALAMQSTAADVGDVQEQILRSVTEVLGFEHAVLASVDQERGTLSGWLIHDRSNGLHGPSRLPHTAQLALRPTSGLLVQALLGCRSCYVDDGTPPTTDEAINDGLSLRKYVVLPLVMRGNPVGILVVDGANSEQGISPHAMASLQTFASQASLVLGNTMLCVDRVRRLTVEEERSRIAVEMHDTLSQSLFGIVCTLDGCIKLLPHNVALVATKLSYLRKLALDTSAEIRRSIFDFWPTELSRECFVSSLRTHLRELDAPSTLEAEIEVDCAFDRVDRVSRRHLLRIAEEALTNAVKHAEATRVRVRLLVEERETRLTVADDGRGFCPSELKNDGGRGRSHFGLQSMEQRAAYLGGSLQVRSEPDRGTEVVAIVPVERIENGRHTPD